MPWAGLTDLRNGPDSGVSVTLWVDTVDTVESVPVTGCRVCRVVLSPKIQGLLDPLLSPTVRPKARTPLGDTETVFGTP